MSLPFTDSVDLLTSKSPAESSLGAIGAGTTTGNAIDVSKRQQLVVQFLRTNHTSGNTVYSIDGSNDGSHWTTGLACQDLTSTTSTTYVTSKTLSSNTSAAVKVPAGWRFIRGVAVTTTDGTAFSFLEAAG